MQTGFKFDFHVPPHPEVPLATHRAVVKKLTASIQAQAKRFAREAKRGEQIEQDYQAQLLQLMGRNKYKRFREYVAKESQAFAEQVRPLKGPELSREKIQQLSSQRREASRVFMDSLGVKADKLEVLNRRFVKRVTKKVTPVSKNGKHEQLSPRNIIGPRPLNPITITPPYQGWAWYSRWKYTGTMYFFVHGSYLTDLAQLGAGYDPQTGLVDCTMDMCNLGDLFCHDWGWAKNYAAVGFWYKMRRAGRIKVWIEAENLWNYHHIDVVQGDEPLPPWADSHISQENSITFQSDGMTDEDAWWTSRMNEYGPGEKHWDHSYWQTGDIARPPAFVSTQGYPINRWVFVLVGTRCNWWETSAREVWVNSDMDFAWKIKSVQVTEQPYRGG